MNFDFFKELVMVHITFSSEALFGVPLWMMHQKTVDISSLVCTHLWFTWGCPMARATPAQDMKTGPCETNQKNGIWKGKYLPSWKNYLELLNLN